MKEIVTIMKVSFNYSNMEYEAYLISHSSNTVTRDEKGEK